VEAFSDGVIAIAITLLVLEIAVPAGGGTLLSRLAEQWPVYLAYLVSFVVVGATWLSHHAIMRDVRRVDHGLLVLNLGLLLVISFIPFPTKVVGEELLALDLGNQRTAAILCGLTFFALGVAFNALWWWARRHDLLSEHVTPDAAAARSRHFRIGPLAYAVTTGLAFVHPLVSIAATGVVAFSFLVPTNQPKDIA
jgi:uncharacterized membrane protein